MTTQPVFLLSLPRSGSTMLQRQLARHPEIATVSEPWFLLGLVDPKAHDDGTASFGWDTYRMAVEDMIAELPKGQADWDAAMRGAAEQLYTKLAEAQARGGQAARFFLDKTPRYALVPQEVARIFPEAPIVVLWRNPLAIAASMMTTWSGGRWNLYRFMQDFHLALPRLAAFVKANPGRVFCVDYDDAVADPEACQARILAYLGLAPHDPGDDRAAADLDKVMSGRMGDPTKGLNRTAATGDAARWKAQFCNPLRRAWGRRLLRRLGDETLAVTGTDRATLEAELNSCKGWTGFLLTDLILMPRGVLRNLFSSPILRRQISRALRKQPVTEMD